MPSDMTTDLPLSIPAIVERAAATFGSAEGLVDGDLRLSFAEVAEQADRAARALVASGVRPSDGVSDVLAAVVLLVAAALGVLFARTLGGRWAVAVAMAWGLGWIAVGRTSGSPESLVVALFAAVAAIVVLAVVPWARQRSRQDLRQASTVR